MPRGILRSEAEEKHSEEKGNGRADAELKKQQEPGQRTEGFSDACGPKYFLWKCAGRADAELE